MRLTSDKYTGIGGRIGTMVGMMNKSGMCFRQGVTPANPKTSYQTTVRNNLKTLATAWKTTLTAGQRQAWNDWAAGLSFVDSLGTPYSISGFDAFVASGGARLVAGLTRVDAGPVTAGLAGFTVPSVAFVVSSHAVTVTFTNTDAWAGEVGGALIGRICPVGFSAGVTYYKGPFRYLNKILGAVTPPTSPATWTLAAGAIVSGTQYALALRAVRADGRYSAETIFRGLGA